VEIRKLTENDARSFWDFRLQALESEPEAFAESADEHRRIPVTAFAQRLGSDPAESFVLGAFDGETLLGSVGFWREQLSKRRHVGRIWGVFVSPEARGKGVGRALMLMAIREAAALEGLERIFLTVAVTQAAARRLYLTLGFQSAGIEPRALKVDGRFVDEEHMTLQLSEGTFSPQIGTTSPQRTRRTQRTKEPGDLETR